MANKNLSNQIGTLKARRLKLNPRNQKCNARGIILDLDGTVVDSKKAYLEAAAIAFNAFAKTLPDEQLASEIPKRIELSLPIHDLLQGIDESSFLKVYLRAYYESASTRTEPFPTAANALERLSGKAMLALITRRHIPEKEVVRQLEKFGLANFFKKVITAEGSFKPKPSPEALLSCIKQMNIEKCECWIVGDSVVDITAGKNAEMKTVAVLSGIFSREELEKAKPDLIFKDIGEFADFLV